MKEKNNYLKGTLGAFLGAILFGIPWVIVYVYGGYILSILALLIAFGSFKFYKLFGGKITKKTSLIIIIVSVLTVSILTLGVIPNMLLLKEGYSVSLSNLKILYTDGKFMASLLKDYFISLIFTGLGISGIIANINKEAYMKNNKDNDKYLDSKTMDEQTIELKNIYGKFNAFNKDNAIPNSVLFNEMNAINKKSILNKFINEGIIINYKGKTYFDTEAMNDIDIAMSNAKKNKKKKTITTLVLTLIIILFSVIIGILSVDDKSDLNVQFDDVFITLPSTYVFSEDDSSENMYTYYSKDSNNIIDIIAILKEGYVNDYQISYIDMLEEDYKIIGVNDLENGFKVLYSSKDNNYIYCDYVYYYNEYAYAFIFASNEKNKSDEFLSESENIVNKVIFSNKKDTI